MCCLHIINTNSMTEKSNFITRKSIISLKNYFKVFEAVPTMTCDPSLDPTS